MEYYNNPREGEAGIKRGGYCSGEVGSGPYAAAWIIKEGFVLGTKEERWRTWERQHPEQERAASQPEMTKIQYMTINDFTKTTELNCSPLTLHLSAHCGAS